MTAMGSAPLCIKVASPWRNVASPLPVDRDALHDVLDRVDRVVECHDQVVDLHAVEGSDEAAMHRLEGQACENISRPGTGASARRIVPVSDSVM